jgi:hypothetical protein
MQLEISWSKQEATTSKHSAVFSNLFKSHRSVSWAFLSPCLENGEGAVIYLRFYLT